MGSVHVEVRFQAQARHDSNGPGLLGCCHLANDLERPTDNAQSPEQGGGCRCLPNFKDIWSPPDQLMSGLFLPGGSWLYCFWFACTRLRGFLFGCLRRRRACRLLLGHFRQSLV